MEYSEWPLPAVEGKCWPKSKFIQVDGKWKQVWWYPEPSPEVKRDPNKITATLKLVIAGEFYDDETTEETLRYSVEQALEDAGFEVDVSLLKEQKAKTGTWQWKIHGKAESGGTIGEAICDQCWKSTYATAVKGDLNYCPNCGAKMTEGR